VVKAKFYVANVSMSAHTTASDPDERVGVITLKPACRGAVNAAWAQATPSGTIEMTVNNPPAFAWFLDRLGRECSITFDDFDADPTSHQFEPHPRAEAKLEWGADLCVECGATEAAHTP